MEGASKVSLVKSSGETPKNMYEEDERENIVMGINAETNIL